MIRDTTVIEAACVCGGVFCMESEQAWFVQSAFETWAQQHFGRLDNGPSHRQTTLSKARDVREANAYIEASPMAQEAVVAEEERRLRVLRWNGEGGAS